MVLPIITYPNKNLREKSNYIDSEFLKLPETQKFIDDLIETMYQKDGLGLAAIQVNKPYRIFVIAAENGPLVFVNTQIIKKSFFKNNDEEGCLSVPDIYGFVKRNNKLTVKATDRFGKEFAYEATGLMARAILHEYDHTQGILFIDKVSKISKGEKLLQALKKK